MSWSLTLNGYYTARRDEHGHFIEGELLPPGLTEAQIATLEQQNASSSESAKVTYAAVRDLIESDAFGDHQTKSFRITMGGHSNPGHEPTAGWTNDYVSLSVSQV